jgi:hypothetical protein
LHHLSRDGDPQLHVHVAIWNRIQRGDGADDTWRTLDSRSLHGQRLGVAPVADRILETRLSALGYVMVARADGNGAEIGGVPQDVMDLFSSRAVAVTGETGRLARDYQAVHGKPPSRRTLWLLHQQGRAEHPGCLPGPAGRLRAAGGHGRGVPRSPRDHRSAAGGELRPAPRARARGSAQRHLPGAGDR